MRSKLPQRWSQSVKLYVQKHQRCEKVNSKSPSFCHSDARSQPFRVALQPAVMSTSDIFTQSQGWPFSSIQDFHDVHPKRSSKTPFESVQVCTRQCWTPVLGWAPCSRKAEAIDPGEQSHDVTGCNLTPVSFQLISLVLRSLYLAKWHCTNELPLRFQPRPNCFDAAMPSMPLNMDWSWLLTFHKDPWNIYSIKDPRSSTLCSARPFQQCETRPVGTAGKKRWPFRERALAIVVATRTFSSLAGFF